MNLRHIRQALRLAGLRRSDVDITQSRHIHLLLNGQRIITACSPKDEHTAALNLAKALKAAMETEEEK